MRALTTSVCVARCEVDTDKIKMVNIVLGLWALTAAELQKGGEMTMITHTPPDRTHDHRAAFLGTCQ